MTRVSFEAGVVRRHQKHQMSRQTRVSRDTELLSVWGAQVTLSFRVLPRCKNRRQPSGRGCAGFREAAEILG